MYIHIHTHIHTYTHTHNLCMKICVQNTSEMSDATSWVDSPIEVIDDTSVHLQPSSKDMVSMRDVERESRTCVCMYVCVCMYMYMYVCVYVYASAALLEGHG